jgi:hypothetical protein
MTVPEERIDSSHLRRVFRAYKRAAARIRAVLGCPPAGLNLTFNLSAKAGGPTTSTFTAGDQVPRHAALLRPFMQPGSEVELRSVWSMLRSAWLVDDALAASVDEAFERADRLSMLLVVNERQLSARDVYTAYGEGLYFGDDDEAKARLEALAVGPLASLVPMLFHEACGNYAQLVFELLAVVRDCERKLPAQPAADVAQCIYCRTIDGDFGPEEHVIPESLGGDGLVIVNSVCRDCNNVLSRLDQQLIEFEPLALLRTVYLPFTKKGQFPVARLGDLTLEKVAPRGLRLTSKHGQSPMTTESQPDGSVRFRLDLSLRHRDPKTIARAAFKIGLGLVAHDAGVEGALDARYDAARAFVRSGEPIATHLVIPTTGKPHPALQTWWLPADQGTPMILDLFGLLLVFNLESAPIELPPEVPAEALAKFWLGRDDEDPATAAAS